VTTSWRRYPSGSKPRPNHKEPPFTTARALAIHDSLPPDVRDEIHEAAKAAAAGVMERFERDRRKR
jgi:TRAP-type C4-dicarboxylate transport system substrate-binding protein